jgi:hypothetical protein
MQGKLEDLLSGIVAKVQGDAKPWFSPLAGLGDSPTNVVNVGGDALKASDDDGQGWTRSIDVPAGANLRFSVLDDGQLGALGLAPQADARSLAIMLRANVGLDLAGNYATGPFTLGGTASGWTSCDLQWIFGHDGTTKVVDALKGDAGTLKDPFSLDALFAMRAVPQWRQARIEIDGALSATLELGAGVMSSRQVLSVSGASKVPVSLSLGLKGTASVRLAGLVHLSATRDDQGLRVRLERGAKQSSQFGLELGAQADVSAWITDASDVLASTLPDPATWLPTLQPLLEPASYVNGLVGDALDARFAPGSTNNLLGRVALGLAPGADAATAFAGRIGGLIDKELQTGEGQLAGHLVALLHDVLPPALNAGDETARALAARIEDWVARKASVDQLAGELAKRLGGAVSLQSVTDPLGLFGAKLQSRLGGSFQGLAQLTSGLRQAIADYATERQKLLDALADAATRKLGLTFGAQYGKERDDSALLDIVILRATPATKALFGAIARGRVDRLEQLLAAAGGDVAVQGGTLRTRLARTHDASVSLQLLGTELGWNARTAATLEISSTLAGDLVAVSGATGEASAEQARIGFFGHYDTTLACVFTASADGGANEIGFRGAYSFAGDKLDSGRLQKLLGVMTPLCPLPPAVDLARRLGLPGDASSSLQSALSNLDLVLPLDLSADEIGSVVASPQSFEDVADVVMRAADDAYPSMLPSGERLSDTIRLAARDSTPAGLRPLLTWAATSATEDIVQLVFGGTTSVAGTDFRYVSARAIRKIGRLCVGIDTMRQELAALQTVQAATLKDNPAAVDAVMGRLGRIADALQPAAVSGVEEHGMAVVWLPWALTAFAQCLAMLAGRPMPGGFVPIAKVDSGGTSRTFALTRF